MAQIINTNIASLNAQRNLNSSQSQLNVSLQRLSSGLRINSAKDDAAGLAISERFTTQIRGINQAIRNSNDGVSLAQTAEGDLAQITNNLQRIRELAVQSANATNSASDRAALQLEVTQLVSEIDRVASTSSFNGVKLLDGSFNNQVFQVGANSGETVSIDSISSSRTSALGQTTGATGTVGTAVQAGFTAGDLTVNGTAINVIADAKAIADAITAIGPNMTATATNVQAAITFGDVVGTPGVTGVAEAFTATNAYAGVTNFNFNFTTDQVAFDVSLDGGTTTDTVTLTTDTTNEAGLLAAINGQITQAITASVDGSGNLVFTADATGVADILVDNFNGDVDGGALTVGDFIAGAESTAGVTAVPGVAPTYTLSLDGAALNLTSAGSDGTITAAEIGTAIDALTGYTASGTGTTLSITKADGSNIALVEAGSDSDGAEGLAGGAAGAGVTSTFRGIVASVVSSSGDLTIAGATPGNAGLTAEVITAAGALLGVTLANTDISTVGGANAAMLSVDSALTTVSTSRSSLGAIQNRFESVVSSLSTSVENLSAARSRIRDADFAQETAALTRNQILQQAGVSILSQANALPQLVLGLLQ